MCELRSGGYFTNDLFSPFLGLIAVFSLLVVTSGCASSYSKITLKSGVEIHTFRLSHNNAHVIKHGDNTVMVDAGLPKDATELAADMSDEGIDPAKLKAIIITHGHADHAGGAKHFKDKYGTKIIVGQGDVGMLSTGKNEKLCPTDALGRSGLDEYQHASYTPFQSDTQLPADASLDLQKVAGISGTILSLPGHTAGSLIVTLGEVVLVGDLFRGALIGGGAERHFYMCDIPDNDADIRRLLKKIAPKAHTFLPGHFGPVDRSAVVDTFLSK